MFRQFHTFREKQFEAMFLKLLDITFTLALLAEIVWIVLNVTQVESEGGSLQNYFFAFSGFFFLAIFVTKSAFEKGGNWLGSKFAHGNPLQNKKGMKKWKDQSWQLVVHVFFTIWIVILLGEEDWYTGVTPWNIAGTKAAIFNPCPLEHQPSLLFQMYCVCQLSVWVVTACSHVLLEERRNDYFAMYFHHLMTIFLVACMLQFNYMRIGSIVLFLHDSSDIIVDLTKMSNYLNLNDDAETATTICFISMCVSWIFMRLYIFPVYVAHTAWFETRSCDIPHLPMCQVFLAGLVCLHIYWFGIFLQMGYDALTKGTHAAAATHIEGSDKVEKSNDTAARKKLKSK